MSRYFLKKSKDKSQEMGRFVVKVVNVMEIVLEQLLEKNWDNFNMPCQCEKCKTDVLAIALNQAPARYISKDNSLAFVKAEFLESQSETNLLIYLSKAAQIVAKNPSCKGNS